MFVVLRAHLVAAIAALGFTLLGLTSIASGQETPCLDSWGGFPLCSYGAGWCTCVCEAEGRCVYDRCARTGEREHYACSRKQNAEARFCRYHCFAPKHRK
jgi:hypothetical protein